MTCTRLQSDGIIEWRSWPFIHFFIILVVIGYLTCAAYKKLKDSGGLRVPDLTQ